LTIKTTKRFATTDPLVVIGSFEHVALEVATMRPTNNWSAMCAISVPKTELGHTPVNSGIALNSYCMDLTGFGPAAQAVPSAITVQVMNPNSLQTTCGMIYGSIMTTQVKFNEETQTFQELANSMVQYMNPRLMAAPKLALRGVQASSFPINMAEIADFKTLDTRTDALVDGRAFEGLGWAPIVFYNPDCGVHPGPNLEYLVTTEWRVRFDTTNPASAGHIQHPISSDSTWSRMMAKAAKLGSGMIDIADVVANTGLLATRFI
jgi:hypothetical protein